MRRYELEAYLANIEKYGITHMIVVPPVCYCHALLRGQWESSATLPKVLPDLPAKHTKTDTAM